MLNTFPSRFKRVCAHAHVCVGACACLRWSMPVYHNLQLIFPSLFYRRKRSQKRRPMSFYTSRSWILAGPNNSEQNWVEHFECTSLGTNSRCETGKENSSCQPFIKSELGIPLAEDIKIKSEITLESAGSVNNYYQILMKRSGTI